MAWLLFNFRVALGGPTEHGCYGYGFRFEGAWAQKWAQSPVLRVFQIALACSKLLILFGS
jgi:hypothetical protein